MVNTNKCGQLTNDGSISPENKLSSTVQDCIKNLVQKKGIKLYNVDVKDIFTNGGNYLGTLQTVDIKSTDDIKNEIYLFVKNTPQSKELFFSLSELYRRENFIYKEVFQKYDQLQEQYKVPENDRYRIVKSYNEMNSEVVILENLTKNGFETCDRRQVLTLKFAEMSISQLAKFHALSFVIQQKEPEYFDNNIKCLKSISNMDYDWGSFVKKTFDVAIGALEGDAKVKLEKYYPVLREKFITYSKLSDEESVCLCHGDFRQNNILVKKVNGVESEIFVIDYQFAHYSCPVLDLIYFIFGSSDQKFRTAHLEHLKEFYYDTFENFLKYFDIRANDVYPRKRYEEDFKEKLDHGLVMFIIIMPLLFASDDVVPDICGEIKSTAFVLDDGYQERIREHVDFFIENGYL